MKNAIDIIKDIFFSQLYASMCARAGLGLPVTIKNSRIYLLENRKRLVGDSVMANIFVRLICKHAPKHFHLLVPIKRKTLRIADKMQIGNNVCHIGAEPFIAAQAYCYIL